MQALRSPFAKDATRRAPRVVTGLVPLEHRDRIVPGGTLVYVEDYKTKFRPKPAAAQATLIEGFERLRGDATQKAAPLYLLDLDPPKAIAIWNDLGIDFILDDFRTRMVIGVYGLAALPGALGRLSKSPADVLDGLSRADVLAVAPAMASARLSSKKKAGQDDADYWLVTWPRTAAIALIPIAVGSLGRARDEAESALRFLDKRRHGGVLREVAAAYGAEASAALDEVLAFIELPGKPSKVPEWASPEKLPPLVGRDGPPLDEASRRVLLELLITFPPELITTFVSFEEPKEGELEVGRDEARHVARFHPEVLRARDELTVASREAVVAALHSAWMGAGGTGKDKWALFAVSALGGDASVDLLRDAVLSSHKEKKHGRARLIVDALALFGTPASLAALSSIANRKALKETAAAAEACLSEAARRAGSSADELADVITPRPAPDATLPPGARLVLGPDLALVVLDGAGARLPPPLTAKAWKEAGELAKRDFLDAATRFERRMVEGRRMTATHFRSAILRHPVLAELAQRLVFTVHSRDDAPPRAAAHVEGTSLVDRAGTAVALTDEDVIGVAHPLDLDAKERAAWSETLSELELLPPFPTLGRPVFAVEAAERKATSIERFAGKSVPTGALLGLTRLGWTAIDDDRTVVRLTRTLRGIHASLPVTPGYHIGRPDPKQPQTLGAIAVSGDEGAFARTPAVLGEVDPVVFSELVREVTTLG
jgi:hypothetical protein